MAMYSLGLPWQGHDTAQGQHVANETASLRYTVAHEDRKGTKLLSLALDLDAAGKALPPIREERERENT